MKKLIVLIVALMFTGCAPVNHHLWGYDHAILIRDAEPCPLLYWSIPGVEDKIWWDMGTVQAHSQYLLGECLKDPKCAAKLPSPVGPVACSYDGKYLYTGIDEAERR